MIAADTNIFARALLDDDTKQSKIAREFLDHHCAIDNLYISPFVLLELAWLLKAKGMERQQIAPIMEKLINADGVKIGQKNLLTAAVHLYSKHNIGFADCMILADGTLNANAKTATFDKALYKSGLHGVAP